MTPAPDAPLSSEDGPWELVFATSHGEFTVRLDPDSAPWSTASLVQLARDGFFDGTSFHRIVPGFVIQGGDPTGTGSGGPGYTTVDRPPAGTRYTKGVVAMAKTAAQAAGTSGSQFFVVTAEDAGLAPDYAVVGSVTEGLDVVERIGELGDRSTEEPLEPVEIRGVEVREP
jgi:peptidyl-prolyl cis-trans isomerase B (cyclophilin B)